MQRSTRVGHSGTFAMFLDGDGADTLEVKESLKKYEKGVDALLKVGYGIEKATDTGFSGAYGDRNREAKWQYDDDGNATGIEK